jgi:hypothetical protein
MKLWHGSPRWDLKEILPISQTHNISSDNRSGCLDVVFLTSDLNHALNYAGRNGCVYEVEIPADLKLYLGNQTEKSACNQLKKLKRLTHPSRSFALTVFTARRARVIRRLIAADIWDKPRSYLRPYLSI